jgi:uncharacterized iron-regulated protein
MAYLLTEKLMEVAAMTKTRLLSASLKTFLACAVLLLSACSEDTATENAKNSNLAPTEKTQVIDNTPLAKIQRNERLSSLTKLAEDAYKKLHKAIQTLSDQVIDLGTQPTQKKLEISQSSWLDAHNAYLNTSIFRTIISLSGVTPPPLSTDNEESDRIIHESHIRIDQYPYIPGYLDAVKGFPSSGLIFSEQTITEEFLNIEHQFSDTAYVAIGFHALEVMLFGDTGNRASTDFAPKKQTTTLTKTAPAARRSEYSRLLVKILLSDIKDIKRNWVGQHSHYQESLSKLPIEALKQLLTKSIELERKDLSLIEKDLKNDPGSRTHENIDAFQARTESVNLINKLTL